MKIVGKKIVLEKPCTVYDVHRFLQREAGKRTSNFSRWVGMTNPNPSAMMTPNLLRLYDHWQIEESTIKYLDYGSWQDDFNIYNRLEILGTEYLLPEGVLKTDGEVFIGERDMDRGYAPAYYLKNASYLKLRGKYPFVMKIDDMLPMNLVAPMPSGESLSMILERL